MSKHIDPTDQIMLHEEEFERFIRKVRTEAWNECADVAGDLKGEFGEPFSMELRNANPYQNESVEAE